MKPNRTSHISETQRPELRDELTRNLRGQGDHSLMQWFGRNKMLAEQARVLHQALVENPNAELPKPGALPGDPRALRGIPAIGGLGSIGGAIAGSRPGDSLRGRRGEDVFRELRRRARSGGRDDETGETRHDSEGHVAGDETCRA